MKNQNADFSKQTEQEWLMIAAQKESLGLPVAALMARNQAFLAKETREEFEAMFAVTVVRS